MTIRPSRLLNRDGLFFQDGSSNNVALSRNYYETTRDLISSVANYTYPAGAQTEISEYAYVNDALGRRTQVTYTGDAFDTGSGTVQTFKYNSRNELRYASASPSAAKRSFGYDNIGNRTFMDIGSGDQTTDYSTNELNQYFLVTKEQSDLGAVSRHCSNMRYDHDGNLTEMWHVDATNTFRGGFVGDMTGPTADMTSEVASASMKRIAPMKMASEETGYESEELLFTEGSLAISLTPLGGGQVGTTLQPHTTYWMTYTTDTTATDFVVVASAESAAQGLQAALAPYSGDWSDNTNFAYVDLESLFGSLDDSGDTRLVKTDIITNHLTIPAGTSGKLCRFTTGDAGELRLHVELIASDSQTNLIDLRTITLNLEVVDSVALSDDGSHDNVVLAASGMSSKIGNRDSSSAEISWPVEGDAAPQLLAWYTHDNGQEDSSALASLTAHTSSSISEDLLSTTDSIFAAPDFSLAMLASILGQTSVTNYDFNNDGDVDIRDYAALMLMGQSQEDQSLLLTWDTENRLMAVEPQIPVAGNTKVTFAYDYKGRRVYKFVYSHDGTDWETTATSQTRYVYDGWRVIEESTIKPAETTERQYTWGLDLSGSHEGAGGIGGLLSMNDVSTSTSSAVTDEDYIYFYDANGNVVQVIEVTDNSSPTLAAHYEYSPYGQRVNDATTDEYDQPFRFSTKMFGSDTECDKGFGNWLYRYYSPELGRWLSRDPIGEAGGPHIYRYVNNIPASAIDPIGLWNYDFHYKTTLELADRAGIACARDIASWANQPDEDYNPPYIAVTSPFFIFGGGLFGMGGSLFGMSYAEYRLQKAREWHFPVSSDGIVHPGSTVARAKVKEGLRVCDIEAFSMGLHVLQDSWSHQGRPYAAGLGHRRGVEWVDPVYDTQSYDMWGNPKVITPGYWEKLYGKDAMLSHTADYTYIWPEDARDAAMATYEYLLDFKRDCKCSCPDGKRISVRPAQTEKVVSDWLLYEEFKGMNKVKYDWEDRYN